ncbi:ABC transporter substrate-binding protein [Anaeromicropila populeti]|uniref:Putative aldouronate transport system substrate-binding protein n=1 Tax=Anaeromicropila populeti TaxID=37658 RepID=A0A1I6IG55_9FIRM|nr:ABC transporter substrate-binding protein [Anaeromicropila populeti]SFR65651.1 putative aldouronate transport system substrate-binding protein [Anaeromicropila populeti]
MKKLVKKLSLLLAMVLMVSSLAACGKKESTTQSGTSDNEASEAGTTETETKEPVILKWIQIGGEPNNLKAAVEAMNEYSISKIGVGVEFVYLDWGIWGDRVTAMINSGEEFDIMFTNSDKYSAAVSLGAFADITDLLAETPELQSMVPDLVWDGVKINNKIYSVPTYKDSSQTQYWVWDKELVEKYNVDYTNIKTLADLDPVVRMFQEEINAGNITDAQYAFNIAKDGVNGLLINYQGPLDAIGVRYDDSSATVVNVFEQEDIAESLSYLHTWYEDGIINPDAATVDRGPSWVIVSSGQGFPGADVSWSAGRGKDTVSNPFAGPIYSTSSILGSANAISSSSKYKVEALKYLELCNTDPVMRNMLAYGVEGVDWTDNGDGTITRSADCYSPATYSQATFFTMYPVAPNAADQWTMVQEWNEKAEASVLLGFSFDRSNVENEMAACDLVMSRYKQELYTGTVDPAEAVPKLYQELTDAGLETIRTEYQNQINDWLAQK